MRDSWKKCDSRVCNVLISSAALRNVCSKHWHNFICPIINICLDCGLKCSQFCGIKEVKIGDRVLSSVDYVKMEFFPCKSEGCSVLNNKDNYFCPKCWHDAQVGVTTCSDCGAISTYSGCCVNFVKIGDNIYTSKDFMSMETKKTTIVKPEPEIVTPESVIIEPTLSVEQWASYLGFKDVKEFERSKL